MAELLSNGITPSYETHMNPLCKARKKYICEFQVSRPYLGFCPDPKHFIVQNEQNIDKYSEK